VPAGHPTFPRSALQTILGDLPADAGLSRDDMAQLGSSGAPGDDSFGLTAFALRMAGRSNAVSALHGRTSRQMWQGVWPGLAPGRVPITHVTNGVHWPTWMAHPVEALLARYIPGWPDSSADPAAWERVEDIPDAEVWATRCAMRAGLAAYIRERSVFERLGRGEPGSYAELAAQNWDDGVLTMGFARRIATYKRLHLLTRSVERGLRIVTGPHAVQLVIAGRAHPSDDDAKRSVQSIFGLNDIPVLAGKVVFLDGHGMDMERRLVAGCDLWLNLPRPLQEASGTSGIKAALNGGLNLSVLDGWWAEAFDGENGWGIDSDPALSDEEQDRRDADALFDLLENEVLPTFYDRGPDGIPHAWVRRIKRSWKTVGPRFGAARMLREYAAVWGTSRQA
jgi:starch phosphorylase